MPASKKMQSTLDIQAYSDPPIRELTHTDKNSTLESTFNGSQTFINCKVNNAFSSGNASYHQKVMQSKNNQLSKDRLINSQRTGKKLTTENN
mmetsp:Transcript_30762/g.30248  ORF Transcript_30762/g.30248 Transcript_30762/m.30248 type:complete len:92 (+) Transcript_30762:1612-1887(+)